MPSYLGIDLGTTNSVAVVCEESGQLTAVEASDGGVLLPSVVRIDGRGNIVVGARARRFLDTERRPLAHAIFNCLHHDAVMFEDQENVRQQSHNMTVTANVD